MKSVIDIHLAYNSETGTGLSTIKRRFNELKNYIEEEDYPNHIILEEDTHIFLLNYIRFLEQKIIENAKD